MTKDRSGCMLYVYTMIMVTVQVADWSHENLSHEVVTQSTFKSFGAKSSRERKPKWNTPTRLQSKHVGIREATVIVDKRLDVITYIHELTTRSEKVSVRLHQIMKDFTYSGVSGRFVAYCRVDIIELVFCDVVICNPFFHSWLHHFLFRPPNVCKGLSSNVGLHTEVRLTVGWTRTSHSAFSPIPKFLQGVINAKFSLDFRHHSPFSGPQFETKQYKQYQSAGLGAAMIGLCSVQMMQFRPALSSD